MLSSIETAKEQPQKTRYDKVKSKVSVSAIVICRNFSDYIKDFAVALTDVLEDYGDPFEIIYVEDGSEDRTYDKLAELATSDNRVKVIKMRAEFGEASAFDAAMGIAEGDHIIYLTTRVRVNPLGIRNLLKKLAQNYDLVVGRRYPRRDSKLNQFISMVFNYFISRLNRLELTDINSGVFVARKEVLHNIPFYGDLNKFMPLLAMRQGYKVTEEDIEQLSARFRQSRYAKEYLQRFLDIITIFFLLNYSKKPLHFLGFFGALFAVSGGIINIYLFAYRLLVGAIAGRPLLLLGTLFFVVGIQMISIGLIGEIIIFTHAKNIKEYNIEKILK